jgi:hypothetical protein
MKSLHHVVTFLSTFPNEWQFDEAGDPIVAGGRECIEFLRSQLIAAGFSASEICERDYYGWELTVWYRSVSFYLILTTVDTWYLHVGVSLAFLQGALLRHPAQHYERLQTVLDDTFQRSGHFSDITRYTRRQFQAWERAESLKARKARNA